MAKVEKAGVLSYIQISFNVGLFSPEFKRPILEKSFPNHLHHELNGKKVYLIEFLFIKMSGELEEKITSH